MACYVSQKPLSDFSVLPFFYQDAEEFRVLDIYTPEGCLGSPLTQVRSGNAYAHHLGPTSRLVSPATVLPNHNLPYLVAGDCNIHNLTADTLRVISCIEARGFTPYFSLDSSQGFSLHNTPARTPTFLIPARTGLVPSTSPSSILVSSAGLDPVTSAKCKSHSWSSKGGYGHPGPPGPP